MSNFDTAFWYTAENEGFDQETDDPLDKGGLTKWGISKNAHPNVDIPNLTEDGAKAIYRSEYWDACRCDEFSDTELAIKVFDCAVNMGCGMSIKLLQCAINDYEDTVTVTVDGKVGPKTIAAANACDPDGLLLFYRDRMIQRYRELAQKDGQSRFLKGWTSRANRMP